MDPNTIALVEECTRLSHGATGKFPEIVGKLMAAGVERYHADLQRGEKTYYLPNGASHVAKEEPGTAFAEPFDPVAVSAAIRASQSSAIDYDEFLTRIAAAGCTNYIVSLAGRRAIYLGRTGEQYTEHFPN